MRPSRLRPREVRNHNKRLEIQRLRWLPSCRAPFFKLDFRLQPITSPGPSTSIRLRASWFVGPDAYFEAMFTKSPADGFPSSMTVHVSAAYPRA
jgi:hypothetical protein